MSGKLTLPGLANHVQAFHLYCRALSETVANDHVFLRLPVGVFEAADQESWWPTATFN